MKAEKYGRRESAQIRQATKATLAICSASAPGVRRKPTRGSAIASAANDSKAAHANVSGIETGDATLTFLARQIRHAAEDGVGERGRQQREQTHAKGEHAREGDFGATFL